MKKFVQLEHLDDLQRGDQVRIQGQGEVYTVTVNYGSRVTAVSTIDITNPPEWEVWREGVGVGEIEEVDPLPASDNHCVIYVQDTGVVVADTRRGATASFPPRLYSNPWESAKFWAIRLGATSVEFLNKED